MKLNWIPIFWKSNWKTTEAQQRQFESCDRPSIKSVMFYKILKLRISETLLVLLLMDHLTI